MRACTRLNQSLPSVCYGPILSVMSLGQESSGMACPEHGLGRYAEGILRTGYPLEFQVEEILRTHGWLTISNRYYLDDVQGSVREIDIVAYKVETVCDFRMYTTLLISCKHSANRTWALLSKRINTRDPNKDWQPLHTWTNCPECDQMLNEEAVRAEYVKDLERSSAVKCIGLPRSHVFAFQEMDAATGRPENDTAVFGSVSTLLKALAYEKSILPTRVAERRLYQFSLLSVVEVPDLLELHFDQQGVSPASVGEALYLADYIVNRERFSARVHFVQVRALEKLLGAYDALHDLNCAHFERMHGEFYSTVLTSDTRRKAVLSAFRAFLAPRIRMWLPDGEENAFSPAELDAQWDESGQMVVIRAGLSPSIAAELNAEDYVRRSARIALRQAFHYSGNFRFAADEPPF